MQTVCGRCAKAEHLCCSVELLKMCVFVTVQYYRLNEKGQIGTGEWCLKSENGDTIHIRRCDIQPTGPWQWEEVRLLFRYTSVHLVML